MEIYFKLNFDYLQQISQNEQPDSSHMLNSCLFQNRSLMNNSWTLVFLNCQFSFGLLLALLVTTAQRAQGQDNAEHEIHQLLEAWHQSASEADFERYFYAMSDDAVFIGTDAKEHWSKTEFMAFSRPYFERGKAWHFETLDRHIFFHTTDEIGWFDETLNTWMGLCRGSGVVEWKNGSWKITHYVLSVLVPNEDIQAVIRAKWKSDSIFLDSLRAPVLMRK